MDFTAIPPEGLVSGLDLPSISDKKSGMVVRGGESEIKEGGGSLVAARDQSHPSHQPYILARCTGPMRKIGEVPTRRG